MPLSNEGKLINCVNDYIHSKAQMTYTLSKYGMAEEIRDFLKDNQLEIVKIKALTN
jgi:hypothetical protein